MQQAKIITTELIEVALPLLKPYKTGFGTLRDRNVLLVRLETEDGHVGWGESAQVRDPLYLEEWLNGSWQFITEYLLPLVHDASISSREFSEKVMPFRRNNISKFSVETALWMIEAKRAGESYAHLLGGERIKIESGASVGMQATIAETVAVAGKKLSDGFERLKLKIQPGWDFEVVQAVRKAFPEVTIMVDANSSYTLDQVAELKKLDQLNLQMIEQPLSYDDIIDHAKLAQLIETPICLDESICSFDDARKAIELGACQIINVKPARVGSLYTVQKINDLAKEQNTQLWCGGMLEGDIGRVANLAAASLSEFTLAADISPSREYFSSACSNLDDCYTAPFFELSNTFGSDLSIDEEWISAHTVRKKTLIGKK